MESASKPTPPRPTLTPIPPKLPTSRIHGTAFRDLNKNGLWEPNESRMESVWFKVTDGGSWFVCGQVGTNSTFGVIVSPGIYYVIPVSYPGYRVTTPRLRIDAGTAGADSPPANIGYAIDDTSKVDGCDQYNPPRH